MGLMVVYGERSSVHHNNVRLRSSAVLDVLDGLVPEVVRVSDGRLARCVTIG